MNLRALRTPIAQIVVAESRKDGRGGSAGQDAIVAVIARHGQISPVQISRELGVSRAYITKAARRLEAQGRVTREFRTKTRTNKVIYRLTESFVA